jgi:competence protein ComEC
MQKLLFVLSISIIIGRYIMTLPDFGQGDSVRISAEITTEPIRYSTSQYIKLMGLKIYLPLFPELTYGDKVVITGKVNNGKLENPQLVDINRDKAIIYGIRQQIIEFYKRGLPEPHSSLVSGVVVGSKQMPESFWEVLRKTGTAHVVVASGTNVTLVSAFLIGVLTYFFKRGVAIYLTIAGIFVYVFLSGFDAPIIRAGIMGTIAFWAQLRGKVVDSVRLLVICALLMLIVKPNWLTDLGFILSFVATISLMLFQTKINIKLKFVPNILREGLSTSLAAQIGVAPIIWVTFGQFNILSPLINALVLWCLPYIMIIGAVAGILGLFVPIIGEIILYLAYPLTWWFVQTVRLFG